MIKSFRDKVTKRLFNRQAVQRLPPDVASRALAKLLQLHAATTLATVMVPPGNRLELLKGDRLGQHSIRINDQWRICFVWRDGDAWDVEVTDYHGEEGVMSIANRGLREAFAEYPPHTRTVPLTHPGVVLRADFLDPMGVSQTELAQAMGVPINRINEICRGKRAISPETAWLLATFFDTPVEFWANLQLSYDLEVAGVAVAEKLPHVRTVKPRSAAQSA